MNIDINEKYMNAIEIIDENLILINTKKLGIKIANELLSYTVLWETDINNSIEERLDEIIENTSNTVYELLEVYKR